MTNLTWLKHMLHVHKMVQTSLCVLGGGVADALAPLALPNLWNPHPSYPIARSAHGHILSCRCRPPSQRHHHQDLLQCCGVRRSCSGRSLVLELGTELGLPGLSQARCSSTWTEHRVGGTTSPGITEPAVVPIPSDVGDFHGSSAQRRPRSSPQDRPS